jgi:hypothetical protein
VLESDGKTHVYSLTNETEVNLSYTLYGADALNLVGKKILLTLNPLNNAQIRTLRITGTDTPLKTQTPATTINFTRRQD